MGVNQAKGHSFGTAPVFLAAISTILGAMLFLRFGYAVGHVGLAGAVLLVLIGHAITIPTGLAVAEIATNLKVEGGGEYFIISRSFGATVGGAIGITLYLSQAISVAFYLIAFAEAFRPLFPWIESNWGFIPDPRMISLPAAVLLTILMVRKGADVGVSALWVVVAVLGAALLLFFLGRPLVGSLEIPLMGKVAEPDSFFMVFAIIFPAFTGMTAGVGLSGDLRNPRRSIPLGTLAATLVGMTVYLLIAVKLAYSATPDMLASDQFVMSKIALWGPIIPIGLAAATISSAIGSILVAPRTLQALAGDKILPVGRWNRALAQGSGSGNDPVKATLFTAVIVVVFVAAGNVDFVAQIISMFFMITYGALCAVSFLEHFAGNPSYRPTFRTRWYLSLLGALAAIIVMFQMQPGYAALAILLMGIIYFTLKRGREDERDLTAVMRGVMLQMTRMLQVMTQKRQGEVDHQDMSGWRPSFICITPHSRERLAPFEMLRWLSHYYGFGTYLHYIKGPLTVANSREARKVLDRLIDQTQASSAGIYVDTIISPSFRTAVAQMVQIPGISGMDNNSILFEFARDDPADLPEIIESSIFAAIAGFNLCVLRSSNRYFGYHRRIHVWLQPGQYRHANLMILLAYFILGHPQWKDCEIRLFDVHPDGDEETGEDGLELDRLISAGRIPISPKNVQRISLSEGRLFDELVADVSRDADLIITGLSLKKMRRDNGRFLKQFRTPNDVLFVRAGQEILITTEDERRDLIDEELGSLEDDQAVDAAKSEAAEAADDAANGERS